MFARLLRQRYHRLWYEHADWSCSGRYRDPARSGYTHGRHSRWCLDNRRGLGSDCQPADDQTHVCLSSANSLSGKLPPATKTNRLLAALPRSPWGLTALLLVPVMALSALSFWLVMWFFGFEALNSFNFLSFAPDTQNCSAVLWKRWPSSAIANCRLLMHNLLNGR